MKKIAALLAIVLLLGSCSAKENDLTSSLTSDENSNNSVSSKNNNDENNINISSEENNDQINNNGGGNVKVKYLAVHKTDNNSGLNPFLIQTPESFNQAGFDEIVNSIIHKGNDTNKLAISYTFSYLRYPLEKVQQSIRNFLDLSL